MDRQGAVRRRFRVRAYGMPQCPSADPVGFFVRTTRVSVKAIRICETRRLSRWRLVNATGGNAVS